MKAQAYYQDAMIIRIFSSESPCEIADLPLEQLTDKSADESLRRIGLQRVTRWKDMYFGKEATVRFRTSNAPLHLQGGAPAEPCKRESGCSGFGSRKDGA